MKNIKKLITLALASMLALTPIMVSAKVPVSNVGGIVLIGNKAYSMNYLMQTLSKDQIAEINKDISGPAAAHLYFKLSDNDKNWIDAFDTSTVLDDFGLEKQVGNDITVVDVNGRTNVKIIDSDTGETTPTMPDITPGATEVPYDEGLLNSVPATVYYSYGQYGNDNYNANYFDGDCMSPETFVVKDKQMLFGEKNIPLPTTYNKYLQQQVLEVYRSMLDCQVTNIKNGTYKIHYHDDATGNTIYDPYYMATITGTWWYSFNTNDPRKGITLTSRDFSDNIFNNWNFEYFFGIDGFYDNNRDEFSAQHGDYQQFDHNAKVCLHVDNLTDKHDIGEDSDIYNVSNFSSIRVGNLKNSMNALFGSYYGQQLFNEIYQDFLYYCSHTGFQQTNLNNAKTYTVGKITMKVTYGCGNGMYVSFLYN